MLSTAVVLGNHILSYHCAIMSMLSHTQDELSREQSRRRAIEGSQYVDYSEIWAEGNPWSAGLQMYNP